jgi:hypothetical protein
MARDDSTFKPFRMNLPALLPDKALPGDDPGLRGT